MNYIITLGIFQSFIALCLFQAGKQRKPADHLLVWLLACICTHLGIKFIIFTFVEYEEVQRGLNTFINLAYGPLLWSFARKIKNDRYLPISNWYIFLPVFLCSLVYLGIIVFMMFIHSVPRGIIHSYNQITLVAFTGYQVVFSILALRISRQLDRFWTAEKKLITLVALFLLTISFVSLLTQLMYVLFPGNLLLLTITARCLVYFFLLVISIVVIRYRMLSNVDTRLEPALVPLSQPEPFVASDEKENNEQINTVILLDEAMDPVRKSSVLSDDQQQKIVNRLKELMNHKKIYTEPELTLEKLAAVTGIPRHHISEALNQYEQKSFYQFVNEFRIEEVLYALNKCKANGITPNILSLALDAGFKSKSSFNQYFKKITGFTPTEYLKQPQKNPCNAPVSVSASAIRFA